MINTYFKKYWYHFLIATIALLGIIFRLKSYLYLPSLWHDECSLAVSIITRNISGMFMPLEHNQCAPLLFMMLTKIVTALFGEGEFQMRLIPFLSGILSIFVFYILSKKVLSTKFSVAVALLLFVINANLIYYSAEFKQYSTDLLIVMWAVIVLSNLNFKTNSYKKLLGYSLSSIIFLLLSFPAAFAIFASFICSIFNSEKKSYTKMFTYLLPIFGIGFVYYLFVLHPNTASQMATYNDYWKDGFLNTSLKSFLLLAKGNFDFMFKPNNFALFGLILFFVGVFKSAKEKNKYGMICLLVILTALIAALLHFYPIKERVALYLIPIIILFVAKPLDFVRKSNMFYSMFILILFVLYFSKYDINYVKYFSSNDLFNRRNTREVFVTLKNGYKDFDTVIVNSSTKADYTYYSHYTGFKPKRQAVATIKRYDKGYYFNVLKSIPTGQNYWFIFGYEDGLIPYLKEWVSSHKGQILQEYNYDGAHLLYVKM